MGGEKGESLRSVKQGRCIAWMTAWVAIRKGQDARGRLFPGKAAVPSAELGMLRKGLVWENGR